MAYILRFTQGITTFRTGFDSLELAERAQRRALANGATTATIEPRGK